MAIYCGIDLGTTNTIVSLCDEEGAEPLLFDGDVFLPSCVFVDRDGTVFVGRSAKNRRKLAPERFLSNAKTFMPDQKTWRIDNRDWTPEDAAREILKYVAEAIRRETGRSEPIHAVVTVPACFSATASAATKRAAQAAGLHCVQLLPEPVAAAYACGELFGEHGRILVADIGGGTFDLAVVSAGAGSVSTQAVGGVSDLGGNLFDRQILRHISRENAGGEREALLGTPSEDPLLRAQAEQELEEIATSLKESLQSAGGGAAEREKRLADGRVLRETITLEEYRALCGTLRMRMTVSLRELLERQPGPFDAVLIVGGMAVDPNVREAIAGFEQISGTRVSIPEDHMDVISSGAALQCLRKSSGTGGVLDTITYTDVGILLQDDVESGSYFQPIIPRGTRITPAAPVVELSGEYYNPSSDISELTILIGESRGSTHPEDVVEAGTYRYVVPPGKRFRLRLTLDSDRTLRVDTVSGDFHQEIRLNQL